MVIVQFKKLMIMKVFTFFNAINVTEGDFGKDFMKIKFNSDDDLPLNIKLLKFHAMTIIIRYVFEEDGKLYLQVFLDDALYELNV